METKSGYVTIIGRPNAGKSTLMNLLVGEKLSIITNKPQTTRKKILGIVSDPGHQIIYLDTPGIMEPAYLLQERMVEYINNAVNDADVLICLFDIDSDTSGNEILKNEEVMESIQRKKVPAIAVINKIDLSDEIKTQMLAAKIEGTNLFKHVIAVSAKLGFNIEMLIDKIKDSLPHGPKYYPDDQLTDEDERFYVTEILREKVFELYRDEIPFSTEVIIDEFKEREESKDYVSASIIVERETQKPIIIGNKGEMIKRLGKFARASIEDFLGREVYLELHVKVKPKWRSNANQLKNFGYYSDND